ncbi:hydrolase [Parafilimonas sp.]|uniref:hydrolase n=1 Tax=Parafilimonas sp. TaxID=1969739 RepID=UPI003F7F1DBD
MSSLSIRDQLNDHLLTPQNAAVLIIDFQPIQVYSINSMNRAELVRNISIVARLAVSYNMPLVLSTVNVKTGINSETIPQLRQVLKDVPSYDRTTINAWEDEEFNEAVKATGRKKLIITALWTEVCLAFPALDALQEGYDVYAVVDAVGGTSLIAHETALRRIEQAGAKLVSVAQLACELQRDWNRQDTVNNMVNALTEVGAFLHF